MSLAHSTSSLPYSVMGYLHYTLVHSSIANDIEYNFLQLGIHPVLPLSSYVFPILFSASSSRSYSSFSSSPSTAAAASPVSFSPSPSCRANPKSVIFTLWFSSSNMFSGFRSRCTMFWACIYSTPSNICRIMVRVFFSESVTTDVR